MNKNNIIIYVSSRNNYDMLSGEVLKNINTEGFEFINVDDKSSNEEIEKGKKICQDNDIVFLENTLRGVQWATQTLIDFINENRPECKWIFCFQHDNYPISENFFSRINKLISDDLVWPGARKNAKNSRYILFFDFKFDFDHEIRCVASFYSK